MAHTLHFCVWLKPEQFSPLIAIRPLLGFEAPCVSGRQFPRDEGFGRPWECFFRKVSGVHTSSLSISSSPSSIKIISGVYSRLSRRIAEKDLQVWLVVSPSGMSLVSLPPGVRLPAARMLVLDEGWNRPLHPYFAMLWGIQGSIKVLLSSITCFMPHKICEIWTHWEK